MPKPKVNKLAKMSDEERARYLQLRADMEEEARRRKRELIARFIKNKLDKEESYSRMNTAKINQQWRYILRKIKCKQMALEIQGMITSFNFMIERKDRLIKSLMAAIEDSDDQHRRAFQAHTETLSYFLGVGSQRLDKLQTEYDFQKNTLLENWDKEELNITDGQDRSEMKLKLIIYIQDRDFQAYKNEKELQRATAKNDARLEHAEDMRILCRPKRLEIETYWAKLRDVYNTYLEQHHPIMGHYQTLREKDDFYRRDIARNELKIQQSTEILLNLQKEWIRTTNTMAQKLKKMANHKEELSRRYWQMKKDSNMDKCKGNEKLSIMVNASQDAIKQLEQTKSKLDKILQMAEICGKYEHSDDEAFMMDIETDGAPVDFENLDGTMINECKEYSKMDKFMLKMNRVKVQTMCLKAEKVKLTKENVQLKSYIKRYLTELALRGGKDRPLSVKLQSEMHKIDPSMKVLNRPVTCIEGALSNAVMHEKRMKTFEKRNKEIGGIRAYPRVQCWMGAS
ncbi:dynein regulatory complex subunit 2 [Galleria mellonella]|uniref:Dynein regulatory complex subunit 2 n=1 Tax=Galleria mellonella TaxID=7137 RepID=A0ABM3MPS7_GALME|nr:dynein regulatory complex subunit 2 [Galleria mellonella]